MLEFEIIKTRLISMFKSPGTFFRDISGKDVDLVIPVVVLIIVGILMGIMSFGNVPGIKAKANIEAREFKQDAEITVLAEKIKALLYPFWVVLFWFFFTIFFAGITSSLGGWGDYKGFFNCTSFFVYPFAALQIIKFILFLAAMKWPEVFIIHWILLSILAVWTFYALLTIAERTGELQVMNAFLAVIVSSFFFSMIWILFSYNYVIEMILRSNRTI